MPIPPNLEEGIDDENELLEAPHQAAGSFWYGK